MFFTCVSTEVSLKVLFLREGLVAVGALEGFFTRVNLLKPQTILLEPERFAAQGANFCGEFGRVLSDVRLFVLLATLPCCELLPAMGTQIGF